MTFMQDSDLASALAGYGKRTNPFDARRKFALQQLQAGSDTSPVQSPWQGVGRLASALAGGLDMYMTDRDEKAVDKKRSDALAQAMAEPDPQKRIGLIAAYDPDTGARAAGQLAIEQAKIQQQQGMLKTGAASFGAGYGVPQVGAPGGPSPLQPLPSGPVPPGDFANNSGNIRASGTPWEGKGPPQNGFETFASPQAGANAHFKNFAAYAQANPNMTVAQAIAKWSPPNENNTQNVIAQIAEASGINPGMPLAEVLKDPMVAARLLDAQTRLEKGGIPQGFGADTFIAAAGGPGQAAPGVPGPVVQPPQGQPPQMAQGDGTPPQPSPQGIGGPAVVAPPVPPGVPDVPRPPPNPEVVRRAQQLMQIPPTMGGITAAQATQMVEADRDRQHVVDRERRFKEFDLQKGDYEAQRGQQMKQPQETLQNEARAREEFNNLQVTKDYRKADSTFRSAVDAAKTNSAAADLNLVYAFATLMDPGSVVREGEMGMVRATQNAGDQVKALVSMVSGGQRLSPEARQNLVDQMAVRHDAYKSTHDELANGISGIAKRSGMNPENIVMSLPPIKWDRRTNNQTGMGGRSGGETVYGLDGKPIP